jgi:MarR family 2-MHQ and catechol resistance regulon transcriptional repressor
MKPADPKSKTDTSGIHLWLVLWKAFRSVEGHALRNIAALDMCLSDFGVLEVLLHKGPLAVNEIGEKVLLTSGSMTAALDRLERRGLLEREEGAEDRRVRVARLTATGRTVIRDAFEDHKRAMEEAASGMAEEDRETLIGLLRQLGRDAEGKLATLPSIDTRQKDVVAKRGRKRNREE